MSAPILNNIVENATSASLWTIGLSTTGAILVNTGGALKLSNATQTADIALELLSASFSATSGQLTFTNGTNTTILQNAQTGQVANIALSLPATVGTAGQVLATDGNNPAQLSWVSAASTASCVQTITHTVGFADTSPYAYFTLPANAIVEYIRTVVVTAFNGASPSLSVGVSGTTSKFQAAGATNLLVQGATSNDVCSFVAPVGTVQALLITFSAGAGATAGSAVVELAYSVPTAV